MRAPVYADDILHGIDVLCIQRASKKIKVLVRDRRPSRYLH